MFFQTWLLAVGIEKPVEFFPDIQPKSMYVNLDVPEGADIDYIDRIMGRIEMAVAGISEKDLFGPTAGNGRRYQQALLPKTHEKANGDIFSGPSDLGNIENIYVKAVTSSKGSIFDSNAPNHVGIQFLDMEERKTSSSDTVDVIRERVKNIPGGRITVAMQEEPVPPGSGRCCSPPLPPSWVLFPWSPVFLSTSVIWQFPG
jgi:hypothetical protein